MPDTAAGPAAGRRVFFALCPPDDLRGELVRAMPPDIRGRKMSAATLHMTLAFIGAVDAERFSSLMRVGAQLRFDPFDLDIDCLGYWPRNHILWAGCGAMPTALSGLAANLHKRLKHSGFVLDERPFFPHITLMRNAEASWEKWPILPIPWRVDECCLVESHLGQGAPRYEIVGRWPSAAA